MMSAIVRLSIDSSMKVAGRKIVESISMPGSPGLQRREHLLDAARHVERVGPRQLLDDHHQADSVVDDGIADHRPGVPVHVGDIAQPRRVGRRLFFRAIGTSARCSGEKTGVSWWMTSRWLGVSSMPSMRVFAAAVYVSRPKSKRVRGRLHDLVERHVVRAHQARIDLHLQRLDAIAPDRDVGHAGHRHEPELDRPVGDHRQVHHVVGLRRDADLHDPAGRRQRLQHHRHAGRLRQLRDRELHALLHALPRLHQIGAHLEQQPDLRQALHRRGADDVNARHAAERVLHRNRDQLFDLGGGHPRTFGLDFDLRRRELGEHVDRHLRSCWPPKTSNAAAAASTRKRNFRLEPMIQVNITRPLATGAARRMTRGTHRPQRQPARPRRAVCRSLLEQDHCQRPALPEAPYVITPRGRALGGALEAPRYLISRNATVCLPCDFASQKHSRWSGNSLPYS